MWADLDVVVYFFPGEGSFYDKQYSNYIFHASNTTVFPWLRFPKDDNAFFKKKKVLGDTNNTGIAG